jgi:hypothetical protein
MRCWLPTTFVATLAIAGPAYAASQATAWLRTHFTSIVLAALAVIALAVVAWWLRSRRASAGLLLDDDGKPLGHFVGASREATAPRAETTASPALPAAVRTRAAGPAFVPDSGAGLPMDEAPAAVAMSLREEAHATAPRTAPPAAHRHAADEDEGSDASQLFLALHHVDLSIEVLRGHLAAEPRPMPAVWVMLLDLCRTHGRESTFREIALEFHARFNVAAPAWDTYPPDRSEPGLEAYPRIVRELTLAWGTHECRRLLDRLLYDNRQGGRRGFTLNAYNDLVALRRAADAVIHRIDEDLVEESKVRSAYASAAAEDDTGAAADGPVGRSPLVHDLESECDADLRMGGGSQSALEREHPALAAALARDWSNAALIGRLSEMLARVDEASPPLSKEAAGDVELLRAMAERRLAEGTATALTPG